MPHAVIWARGLSIQDCQLGGKSLSKAKPLPCPKVAVGRCARVPKAAEGMSFQNHLFRLRGKEINSDFACLWLNSLWARRYWRRMCATSSGLNTINQPMLRALLISKPELAEQLQISQLAASAQEQIDKPRLDVARRSRLRLRARPQAARSV
jgi:type I restriction enzyme, S subunit